jgi:Zn-dependent protease
VDLSPEYLILRIPAILFALTIHECAHGWVAYRLGDRTAYDAGRITLNPFAHLDVLGSIMLLFGPFGWAKPVPVDPRYFQKPKQGILYVSAAGPLSNVALALLFGYTYRLTGLFFPSITIHSYLKDFLELSILINTGIAFFNLLPVPPLDGSKILLGILPDRMIPGYLQKSRYVPHIFMALLLLEWIAHVPIFSRLIYPLFIPFNNLINLLIYWRF